MAPSTRKSQRACIPVTTASGSGRNWRNRSRNLLWLQGCTPGLPMAGYPKIDGVEWNILFNLFQWMIWGYPHFRKLQTEDGTESYVEESLTFTSRITWKFLRTCWSTCHRWSVSWICGSAHSNRNIFPC